MEIQRHNIFDLIGGRQNLYHSAILTSYTFDPIFFETFYLPRLRQCGVSNVVVLLDASNYDKMLLQYPSFGIQSDRRLYTLIRQIPTNNGVFHPKITMLFGEDAGLLIVGSGNLTYNGYAINEEVWNTFSLKGSDSVYLPLFRSAWNYLNALNLPDSMLLRQQLKWITDNVSWLSTEATDEDVIIDHHQFLFIANDSEGTILSKLQNIVGNEQVESITTISPFYDTTGQTVKTLYDCFKPHVIECIYSDVGIYPYDLMKDTPEWLTLYSWEDVFTSKRSDVNRLHAKIIQLSLSSSTVLMSGSANVTNAAFNGAGDEATIAIISQKSEDYIKKLGVNLNRHSAASPLKIEMLSKPERTNSESIVNKIQIIYAEVVDNTLTVITNSSNIVDFRLRILDVKGNEAHTFDILSENGKLQIKSFTSVGCIVVIIDSCDNEISNRYFIINEDEVAKFNPNKALRKLDSLLESNKDWKDNLAGILSYLWYDNSANSNKANMKVSAATIKKEVAGKSVSHEDFDNIRIGSRQNILSLPDVRIIDFLLSSDRKTDVDLSDSSDDVDALHDVDDGGNEYHSSERSVEKRKQDSEFIKCIDKYSRLLRKHYDSRLDELYSKAAKFGTDIFKTEFKEKTSYISVSDYSRILVDIVLMWNELTDNSQSKHGNIRQDFIRNLGRFLLLARKGYEHTNDYAFHKCVEFQKELIVFSLLIIASQEWRRKEIPTIKLLISNLMSSCSVADAINADEIVMLFLKKIDDSKIIMKPGSMALINKTISDYKSFSKRLELKDPTIVRDVDLGLSQGNYAFKTGYGFFYVSDIKPVRQSNNDGAYEMILCHPGFDDPIKLIGKRKIRALS